MTLSLVGLSAQAAAGEPGQRVVVETSPSHPSARGLPADELDRSLVPTGVLRRTPLSAGAETADAAVWRRMYFELRRDSLDPRGMASITDIDAVVVSKRRSGRVVVGIIDYQLDELISAPAPGESLADHLRRPGSLRTEHVLISAALTRAECSGGELTFDFDSSLFFSNRRSKPDVVWVDFDDGKGFRPVAMGGEVEVSYESAGEKLVTVSLTEGGGERLSRFAVGLDTVPQPDEIWTLQATIPYFPTTPSYLSLLTADYLCSQPRLPGTPLFVDETAALTVAEACLRGDDVRETALRTNPCGLGRPDLFVAERALDLCTGAVGEAYLYKSPAEGPLDRPVVIVEAFDPDNRRDWCTGSEGLADGLYARLNSLGLIEDEGARHGFDFIILNFGTSSSPLGKGGGDFVQKNALLLVELINRVNAEKSGEQELVVLGASMGGLVARYALAYMEAHDIPHHTGVFVTFDSPHQGANIPLGVQHWLEYLEDRSSEAADGLRILNTPAALQLLRYHWAARDVTAWERTALVEELEQMGDYPGQPRKVAIANGSARGDDQGYSAGLPILNIRLGVPGVFMLSAVARSVGVDVEVFRGQLSLFFFKPVVRSVVLKGGGWLPLDHSPGGRRDTMGRIAESSDAQTRRPHHSFVATISALDVETDDLFLDVAGLGEAVYAITPFDEVCYPCRDADAECDASNQDHIQITQENQRCFLEAVLCTPPRSSDWVVTGSCTLRRGVVPISSDLVVEAAAELIIERGATLDLVSERAHLLVRPGGRVVVKPGGLID